MAGATDVPARRVGCAVVAAAAGPVVRRRPRGLDGLEERAALVRERRAVRRDWRAPPPGIDDAVGGRRPFKGAKETCWTMARTARTQGREGCAALYSSRPSCAGTRPHHRAGGGEVQAARPRGRLPAPWRRRTALPPRSEADDVAARDVVHERRDAGARRRVVAMRTWNGTVPSAVPGVASTSRARFSRMLRSKWLKEGPELQSGSHRLQRLGLV